MLVDPSELGKVVWNDEFRFTNATQNHVIQVCEDIAALPFVARDEDTPVLGTVTCIMSAFRDFALNQGYGFPVSEPQGFSVRTIM